MPNIKGWRKHQKRKLQKLMLSNGKTLKDQLLELYREAHSWAAVAMGLGVTEKTLARWRREAGIFEGTWPIKADKQKEIVARFGKPLKEVILDRYHYLGNWFDVASELGTTIEALRRWRMELDIEEGYTPQRAPNYVKGKSNGGKE